MVLKDWDRYRKNPKNLDTENICCNHPEILTRWPYRRDMGPKDVEGMANSVDPDQTALFSRSSLIWIHTVCPDLSVRKLRIIAVSREQIVKTQIRLLKGAV